MEGIFLFNEYDNHIFSILSIKRKKKKTYNIFYAVTSIWMYIFFVEQIFIHTSENKEINALSFEEKDVEFQFFHDIT